MPAGVDAGRLGEINDAAPVEAVFVHELLPSLRRDEKIRCPAICRFLNERFLVNALAFQDDVLALEEIHHFVEEREPADVRLSVAQVELDQGLSGVEPAWDAVRPCLRQILHDDGSYACLGEQTFQARLAISATGNSRSQSCHISSCFCSRLCARVIR